MAVASFRSCKDINPRGLASKLAVSEFPIRPPYAPFMTPHPLPFSCKCLSAEGGLARDDSFFGSTESVTPGRANFRHRIRIKGNWDAGRFGRVKFLARLNNGSAPTCARPTRSILKQTYIYFIARVKPNTPETGN